jgi:membrane protease subunit HflK
VLAEYQKAPQVTRDRMYIDAMQQMYSNVTKVMVDSKQGSNLLYLPLDKLIQMTGQVAEDTAAVPAAATPTAARPAVTPPPAPTDSRTRDAARTRTRETR